MKTFVPAGGLLRRGFMLTAVLGAVAPLASARPTVVKYDPTGYQDNSTPTGPAVVHPAFTATSLSQVGIEAPWSNAGLLPVGRVSGSASIMLGEYMTFQVDSGATLVDYSTLTYDAYSYLGLGARTASVRTSLDGFAADVDTISTSGIGYQFLTFDLSSLATTSGAIDFRIYFYDAAVDRGDWMDLRSSDDGGRGLVLNASAVPLPSAASAGMAGLIGLTGAAGLRRRRA